MRNTGTTLILPRQDKGHHRIERSAGYSACVRRLKRMTAKDLTHHPDQAQHAFIANPVIDPIGMLACNQYPLLPQDSQVLGDIALRRTHDLDNILHADFLTPQGTQDLQTEGMRHRLQGTRRQIDILIIGKQRGTYVFHKPLTSAVVITRLGLPSVANPISMLPLNAKDYTISSWLGKLKIAPIRDLRFKRSAPPVTCSVVAAAARSRILFICVANYEQTNW
jgi:hypothetical protein